VTGDNHGDKQDTLIQNVKDHIKNWPHIETYKRDFFYKNVVKRMAKRSTLLSWDESKEIESESVMLDSSLGNSSISQRVNPSAFLIQEEMSQPFSSDRLLHRHLYAHKAFESKVLIRTITSYLKLYNNLLKEFRILYLDILALNQEMSNKNFIEFYRHKMKFKYAPVENKQGLSEETSQENDSRVAVSLRKPKKS